jgi:ABC-2 type transport system permease protein
VTGWSVVARQEIRDLWIGGRGTALMTAYTILLSAISYLAATNQQLNFLERREAVNLVVQVALATGVLVTLLVSADAISGERERRTLESLLLAPISRSGIAIGKQVAALSLWLVCALVALPYLWVLGRGTAATGPAMLMILATGTLVAVPLAGLGLLASGVSSSNRVSIAISLFVLLALFAPTQLPGMARSWFGELLIRVDPLASALEYTGRVLVAGHGWRQDVDYLLAPAILLALTTGVLLLGGSRLVRLNAGLGGE